MNWVSACEISSLLFYYKNRYQVEIEIFSKSENFKGKSQIFKE